MQHATEVSQRLGRHPALQLTVLADEGTNRYLPSWTVINIPSLRAGADISGAAEGSKLDRSRVGRWKILVLADGQYSAVVVVYGQLIDMNDAMRFKGLDGSLGKIAHGPRVSPSRAGDHDHPQSILGYVWNSLRVTCASSSILSALTPTITSYDDNSLTQIATESSDVVESRETDAHTRDLSELP